MGQSYRHFTLEDRCAIARLREDGQSIRQIAAALGRAPSSISREIARNTGHGDAVAYKPAYADDIAWSRRWRGSRLERDAPLRALVLTLLATAWSPEQIAGRLKLENCPQGISHESIYRFIHAQIKRTKDYSWRHLLPRGKSKRGLPPPHNKSIKSIKNRVSIHQRPKSVMARKSFGHWEADLLHPQKSGAAILVANERKSRYTLLAKLDGKHAEPVADQLTKWLEPLPKNRKRSVTHDNGTEFACHHKLNQINIQTFFCDPHKPWQKGSVENTNGRIRRFIPRGTDPSSFSNHDLQILAKRLNNTPRKCLGFRTPEEIFSGSNHVLHFKCESTFPPSRE
jgi:transposase, IS30 family